MYGQYRTVDSEHVYVSERGVRHERHNSNVGGNSSASDGNASCSGSTGKAAVGLLAVIRPGKAEEGEAAKTGEGEALDRHRTGPDHSLVTVGQGLYLAHYVSPPRGRWRVVHWQLPDHRWGVHLLHRHSGGDLYSRVLEGTAEVAGAATASVVLTITGELGSNRRSQERRFSISKLF
jgi:hypothetical protein